MTRFAKTTALAAAAAAVMSFAQPAAAQGLPTYCNNTLYTNSLYANVLSDGRTAQVQYHGQFQNRSNRPMTANMLAVSEIVINNNRFPVVRHIATFDLNSYEQKDVQFLTIRVNNPAGTGAPSAVDVGRAIRFTCTAR
ncbi:hypothetical protein KTR66_22845 [Roseococcus sp. SDR]|uniref:hypothetical protein n=1 Tax=Roseococcus sp. SDR TaxID=2835532 RepID=UPI001BCC13AC|nr:hypothetical protein [Roseococcus sp. SDR]MBS7792845.1 hypothetical protein [Roseococcus sp. SDR]MBV1848159.1 hypothetical protein [Roseococcus sp. SDR]